MSKNVNSPPPFEKTELPGGSGKIIQICEDLRDRNTDGYVPTLGGILANIKEHGSLSVCNGTTCSPFTATVIGVAFDPKYPRDDLNGDPYEPKFNGGRDPLMPFSVFYNQHQKNNNQVESVLKYNLAEEKLPGEMRRGDLLEIDWYQGDGHAVFCWDVHLDAGGEVDCFQIIGSNGSFPGVSVWAFNYDRWLVGQNAKIKSEKIKSEKDKKEKVHWSFASRGTYKKAPGRDKIFVDDDELVRLGAWVALPRKTGIKKDTFRVAPHGIIYSDPDKFSVHTVRVARFFGAAPPAPYCMKTGPAPSTQPISAKGHFDAQPTTVPKQQVKKVEPKPAAQEKEKPLETQRYVEFAMRMFYAAHWITSDPGDSENINDEHTKAAVEEFQTKFKLKVDGIVGPQTKEAVRKQLPACIMQLAAEALIGQLHQGGKLSADPAQQLEAAVKEFQQSNGLDQTGVLDADTQAKLRDAIADHAASEEKHGLNPTLLSAFWLGNEVAPGGSLTLRVHSVDVKVGQELQILLADQKGKQVESAAKMVVSGPKSETSVPMPAEFGEGTVVVATLKASLDGGKSLQAVASPITVRTPKTSAVSGKVEVFFNYRGWIGPAYGRGKYDQNKKYTYVGYRVPGKPAWFLRGRGNVDVDGAPNAYHPDPAMDRNFVHAGELATWDVSRLDRPLENLANGPVGLQKKDGKLYVQTASDPCPGYYVMHTPLRRKMYDSWDPREYSDARVIPYFAIPTQVLGQAHSDSQLPGFGGWEAVGQGHTGAFGDYVTAVNLNPRQYRHESSYPPDYLNLIEIDGKKYPVAHGLIGDAGNQPHIGECSYAFARMLHTLDGPEWADVLWMIHPGSGKGQYFIPEPGEIQANGEKLFNDWGGKEQLAAVLKLPELSGSGR